MTAAQQQLGERLAALRASMEAAARRAGRPPGDVTLVAVTKSAPPGIFELLARAGVRDAGESRVQDAEARLAGREHAFRWHLVGHLQSNKVRRAVALFDVFHGIDSAALLARVDRAAGELGRRPELLLQVNVSGEASKHGLRPAELPGALDVAATLEHARVTGLMTMAPESADSEETRAPFRALAALRDRCARPDAGLPLAQLSMGMSDDFTVAIEEGATLVRIGRSLVARLPLLLVLLLGAARFLVPGLICHHRRAMVAAAELQAVLDALRVQDGAVLLPVRAAPGARREGLVGVHAGALRIATTAPPQDGRATQRIGEALAEALGLARGAVECVGGATARDKLYRARGISLPEVRARLAGALS